MITSLYKINHDIKPCNTYCKSINSKKDDTNTLFLEIDFINCKYHALEFCRV